MNLTAIFGCLLAVAVVHFGVFEHSVRPEIFLNTHALALVLGGTFATALMAFPLRLYRDLFRYFFLAFMFPAERATAKIIPQILLLAARPEPSELDAKVWSAFHPFVTEGYMLLKRGNLSSAELKMILSSRSQRHFERHAWNGKILNALAKYPPAFGLLGASTGMIAMMSNLGSGGKDVIGPSMASALVATFWGIGMANFVFLPLADHAHRFNSEDGKQRAMIASALVLIHQGARPEAVFEYLLGYLPVAQRTDANLKKSLFFAQNRSKEKAAA